MSAPIKTFGTDFTEAPIAPALLRFSLPLFLASLLQVFYNAVDMVVVGQVLGKEGLSAVSVGGDVANLLTFIAMGFANAAQVLISQLVGAKKREKLGSFIGTAFSFSILCALLLGVVCLFFRTPILQLMNTPEEAFADALGYATVSMIGLVFVYGYNVASAVLRGMGDSKRPFIFIAIASVLNVVLDLLFVLGLGMRAMGAALATVISQGASFVFAAVFVFKNKARFDLSLQVTDFLHIKGEHLSPLLKLGVPMAIKSASIQISKLFVNSYINSYGLAVSGFAGIANKIGSISNLFSNSLNTAGSSMVGQNVGAKKYGRVPKIVLWVALFTFGIASLLSLVLCLFPREVYSIFTKDAEVLAVGLTYLPIAVLIFFGSAARAPMNALINGSGNYRVNFATAILDGVVMRIGLSVLFGLYLGMESMGFWLGDALAGFTPFFIGIVFYLTGSWKKTIKKSEEA